jgi:hypothetical protein
VQTPAVFFDSISHAATLHELKKDVDKALFLFDGGAKILDDVGVLGGTHCLNLFCN